MQRRPFLDSLVVGEVALDSLLLAGLTSLACSMITSYTLLHISNRPWGGDKIAYALTMLSTVLTSFRSVLTVVLHHPFSLLWLYNTSR
jgi:hypothetical protein